MALFTDGLLGTNADLNKYETGILDLASIEGIDLTAKRNLAQQNIGNKILKVLLRKGDPSAPTYAVSSTPRSGRLDPQWLVRRKVELSTVVATPPMYRWHTFASLTLVYQDAYNNQLNDRYLGKWKEYSIEADLASADYFEIGIGIVFSPVIQAKGPALGSSAGIGAANWYFVQVSWIDGAGNEGSPSEILTFQTADNTQLVVIANDAPPNAAGWNVYAGLSEQQISLQTAVPVPVGGQWNMPPSGLRTGQRPGSGQRPDYYVTNVQVLQRG